MILHEHHHERLNSQVVVDVCRDNQTASSIASNAATVRRCCSCRYWGEYHGRYAYWTLVDGQHNVTPDRAALSCCPAASF